MKTIPQCHQLHPSRMERCLLPSGHADVAHRDATGPWIQPSLTPVEVASVAWAVDAQRSAYDSLRPEHDPGAAMSFLVMVRENPSTGERLPRPAGLLIQSTPATTREASESVIAQVAIFAEAGDAFAVVSACAQELPSPAVVDGATRADLALFRLTPPRARKAGDVPTIGVAVQTERLDVAPASDMMARYYLRDRKLGTTWTTTWIATAEPLAFVGPRILGNGIREREGAPKLHAAVRRILGERPDLRTVG